MKNTTFVLSGITGNLAATKTFPAIFSLDSNSPDNEYYRYVGVSRRDFSDTDLQRIVKDSLTKNSTDESQKTTFVEKFLHTSGELFENSTYKKLQKTIDSLDIYTEDSQVIFYFSLPTHILEHVFSALINSKIVEHIRSKGVTVKVLIEKPYGLNTETARLLDSILHKGFDEKELYRIDHYFGKSTLQRLPGIHSKYPDIRNILQYKEGVEVSAEIYEEKTIDGRGGFYDAVGALRDVGQNHLLAMLSVLIAKTKNLCSDESIRSDRAQFIDSLTVNTSKTTIHGQYENYHATEGVAADSKTETFFKVHLRSSLPEYAHIYFMLSAGKGLNTYSTKMKAVAKNGDTVEFFIQPKRSVHIHTEKTEVDIEITPATYEDYEKVFYDCLQGDKCIFANREEINASWKLTEEISRHLSSAPLIHYQTGTSPDTIT